MTAAYAVRPQAGPVEGIAVTGEALQRIAPESAEFVVEIGTAAPSAAQALRDHQAKAAHLAQTVAPLGVQRTDLQTVSINVLNTYSSLLQGLPAFGGMPQIGTALGNYSVGPFGGAATPLQPDVQFGSYQARSLIRVRVRETARVGEVVDALAKAGAVLAGGISFRVADEASARKTALEAAGKDARAKAEILAAAAGRQVGEPMAISEEVLASNGVYTAMRAQAPLAFGPETPQLAGELEYYARVTANFRFQ